MSDDSLSRLYPFLGARERGSDELAPALLESIRQKAADSARVKAAFFADQGANLLDAATALADVYRNGGRLLCAGNGGSSCDAAHVAVEFLHPVTAGRPALPAHNLVADPAMLSAVGNDLGFDHVFLRQLVALGRQGDCLLGISTSGSSENLLRAFEQAKDMGIVTLALLGGEGGKLAVSGFVDHCLIVGDSSIHRVQETHVAIYHILWDLVHSLLADSRQ